MPGRCCSRQGSRQQYSKYESVKKVPVVIVRCLSQGPYQLHPFGTAVSPCFKLQCHGGQKGALYVPFLAACHAKDGLHSGSSLVRVLEAGNVLLNQCPRILIFGSSPIPCLCEFMNLKFLWGEGSQGAGKRVLVCSIPLYMIHSFTMCYILFHHIVFGVPPQGCSSSS